MPLLNGVFSLVYNGFMVFYWFYAELQIKWVFEFYTEDFFFFYLFLKTNIWYYPLIRKFLVRQLQSGVTTYIFMETCGKLSLNYLLALLVLGSVSSSMFHKRYVFLNLAFYLTSLLYYYSIMHFHLMSVWPSKFHPILLLVLLIFVLSLYFLA